MFEGLSTVAMTPLVLEWMDQTAQTTFRYLRSSSLLAFYRLLIY